MTFLDNNAYTVKQYHDHHHHCHHHHYHHYLYHINSHILPLISTQHASYLGFTSIKASCTSTIHGWRNTRRKRTLNSRDEYDDDGDDNDRDEYDEDDDNISDDVVVRWWLWWWWRWYLLHAKRLLLYLYHISSHNTSLICIQQRLYDYLPQDKLKLTVSWN